MEEYGQSAKMEISPARKKPDLTIEERQARRAQYLEKNRQRLERSVNARTVDFHSWQMKALLDIMLQVDPLIRIAQENRDGSLDYVVVGPVLAEWSPMLIAINELAKRTHRAVAPPNYNREYRRPRGMRGVGGKPQETKENSTAQDSEEPSEG